MSPSTTNVTHSPSGWNWTSAPRCWIQLLRGEPATEQSDIWALGVMLYEMGAGRRPFVGATGFELTASILGAAVPPMPTRVPGAIRAVILRALSPDLSSRYQHAGELRAALETVLQLLDERVEAKDDRAAGVPSRPVRKDIYGPRASSSPGAGRCAGRG